MSARQRRECNKEGPADHPMGKRPACFVIGLGPDRKDQIVFSQGEVADAIFYIQQGKVKLIVVSEQGKEAVVAILGPGQFFGEACLNGNPLRIAATHRDNEGARRMRDCSPGEGDNDRNHSQKTGIF